MDIRLNEEQRAAVEAPENKVFVLAGPGAGKTRVLTARINYLLQQGTPGSRIRAITFTRKAAGEMKARLAAQGIEARHMFFGTFHSFCHTILKRNARSVGLKPNYSILDEQDQNEIKMLLARMYRVKKTDPEIERIYRRFLRRINAVDFDTLEEHALKIVTKYPVLVTGHTLVDEFQDTSPLQNDIIAAAEKLFLVGDPRQAIYGFRGATAEHTEKTAESLGCKEYLLETNFRSEPEVIGACRNIFPQYSMKPNFNTGFGAFEREFFENEIGERKFVENWLKKDGSKAILVRTNFYAERIAEQLKNHDGVKIVLATKSADPWQYPSFRAALRLLRLVENPADDFTTLLLLEIFQMWANAIDAEHPQESIKIFQMWANAIDAERPLLEFVPGLHDLIMRLQQEEDNVCVRLLALFSKEKNYPDRHKIYQEAVKVCTTEGISGTSEFLRYLSDRSVQDQVPEGPEEEENNTVIVSTIHTAKGLEWDHVLVPCLEQGNLPHSRALHDDSQREEERRVLFVAVSRARESLTLSTCPWRELPWGNRKKATEPSEFLRLFC